MANEQGLLEMSVSLMNIVPTTESDELRKIAEEIHEYLKDRGKLIFHGSGDLENLIFWDHHGGDWKVFLQVAEELGCKPIYFRYTEFTGSYLDDLDETDKRNFFSPKVGQVFAFEVSFIWNGVHHAYRQLADWFFEYKLLVDEDFDEDDDDDMPF